MEGFLVILAISFIGTFSTASFPQCTNIKQGDSVPYPGDCTKYVQCINGGVEKNCPATLHFNAMTQICDYPSSANCTTDTKVMPQCMSQPSGKSVPYPGDCSKFILCIGDGEIKSCPGTLEFNAKLENCDVAANAGCSQNGNTIPNDKVDPSLCQGKRLGELIPFPGICTQFINCINGGIVQYCPDNLHFNAKLHVCDWKENAGCILK